MNTPERLNWELRDSAGHIVAAFTDRAVAEAFITMGIVPRCHVEDCNYVVTHKAWFPCDFGPYFDIQNPRQQVIIEDIVYQQKRTELEV